MSAQLLQFILYFLFSFVVFIFSLFNIVVSKTTILPGIKNFVVVSGSMVPQIPLGSIIYTDKNNNYTKGEIVAFLQNGNVIAHRIVDTEKVGNELYYVTRGDANALNDVDLTTKSNIIGKTVFSVPYVGELLMLMKTPKGFVWCISLMLLPYFATIVLINRKNLRF